MAKSKVPKIDPIPAGEDRVHTTGYLTDTPLEHEFGHGDGAPIAAPFVPLPDQVIRPPEKSEPCTDHAGMKGNFCLRCGMPLGALAVESPSSELDVDSKVDKAAAGIDPIWLERAEMMARAQSITVTMLLEQLIKRQWIASGAGKGKR